MVEWTGPLGPIFPVDTIAAISPAGLIPPRDGQLIFQDLDLPPLLLHRYLVMAVKSRDGEGDSLTPTLVMPWTQSKVGYSSPTLCLVVGGQSGHGTFAHSPCNPCNINAAG